MKRKKNFYSREEKNMGKKLISKQEQIKNLEDNARESCIKELSNRTGTKVSYHHGTPYIDIGFDTDALECHLYDKNGKNISESANVHQKA